MRPISYEWEGHDEVLVFSSPERLEDFKMRFQNVAPLSVERLVDDEQCLNFILRSRAGDKVCQFFAAIIINSEDEANLDIMAYIGESEFESLNFEDAILVGVYFKFSPPNSQARESGNVRFSAIDEFTDDFMEERGQPSQQQRDLEF